MEVSAYQQGINARQWNLTLNANPYHYQTGEEHQEWIEGWEDEEDRIISEMCKPSEGWIRGWKYENCEIVPAMFKIEDKKPKVTNKVTNINYTNELIPWTEYGEVSKSDNSFTKPYRTFVQGATAFEFGQYNNPYSAEESLGTRCIIERERCKYWLAGFEHERKKQVKLKDQGWKKVIEDCINFLGRR